MLAMHWYHMRAIKDLKASTGSKLRSLALALIKEPINMVIIIGLILSTFGHEAIFYTGVFLDFYSCNGR